MPTWKDNPGMEWWDTRGTPKWVKISDHNRSEISVSTEAIENKQRMVDGTLRKYYVTRKRTWSMSWDQLPSVKTNLLVNGEAGEWMEQFVKDFPNAFTVRFRKGSDTSKATADLAVDQEVKVMISDFSKTIIKRGPTTDLWSLDLTLEEV